MGFRVLGLCPYGCTLEFWDPLKGPKGTTVAHKQAILGPYWETL